MSRIYDTIYKANLIHVDLTRENEDDEYVYNIFEDDKVEIMYRIISINDQLLYAEEISTGCIFPICAQFRTNDGKSLMFLTFSYLLSGKYYIGGFWLTNNTSLGRIIFDEETQKSKEDCPSTDEIDEYLSRRENDNDFKNLMLSRESENRYLCDLAIIKAEIRKLKGTVPIRMIKLEPIWDPHQNK